MNRIYVESLGAVSPAGWGIQSLVDIVQSPRALPPSPLDRPGWGQPLQVRRVPTPPSRPPWMLNPRMRRVSPITQFAAAAALEAIPASTQSDRRLGIVFCTTCGCVHYSRRFYDEVLKNPALASPMLFPETVFNAPASHLASLLSSPAPQVSLVGDSGVFLHGIALASAWLLENTVDACLVVAAEEVDWVTADALQHFRHRNPSLLSEGAGALLLSRSPTQPPIGELVLVTDPHAWGGGTHEQQRIALEQMARQLGGDSAAELGVMGSPPSDPFHPHEHNAIEGANRRLVFLPDALGQGFAAAAAWQCIVGLQMGSSRRMQSVLISVPGAYQESVGARFAMSPSP